MEYVIALAGAHPVKVVGVLPVYVSVRALVASGDTTMIVPDVGKSVVESTVSTPPAVNPPLVLVERDAPTPIAPRAVSLTVVVRCPIMKPA